MTRVGPIGRLGRYTATHFRVVLIAWLLVAVVLGFFATRVETALSGAGWETTGSQSVQARQLVDRNFHGLSSYALLTVISSPTKSVSDPAFQSAVAGVERRLRGDGAVSTVIPPTAGVSISRDRHTAIVQAGAARDSNAMVQAADRLKGKLAGLTSGDVRVSLTGAPAMWSDFNAANRSAMLKSEVISWPVTLADPSRRVRLAGRGRATVDADDRRSCGGRRVAVSRTKVMPVSIWAMNFALMFALALGVDYALFIVHRFRGALLGSRLSAEDAIAVTMDTAGKAVLFSGTTVLISLSAVMLVPSPAFRSTSLGIMLAVIFVLAATLTLLPAVLAKLDRRVDKLALPWARPGEHRSARFAAWGERLWRRPVAYGALALAVLVALAIPVTQLKTAMPSIKVVPVLTPREWATGRYRPRWGPERPGRYRSPRPRRRPPRLRALPGATRGSRRCCPPRRATATRS